MKETQLTGIPRTLLLPLAANFYENKRSDCILFDAAVNSLVETLSLDFSFFLPDSLPQLGMVVRRWLFDRQVSAYLRAHPSATVVNLGAGLCTRFFRLPTKNCRWFNLDVPEVEKLWKSAFSETERLRFITASAFDTTWYQDIPRDLPILFISEAMLCYHDQNHVKNLFRNLLREFEKYDFIFEVYNSSGVKRSNQNPALARTGTALQWGVDNIQELGLFDNSLTILKADNFPWRYVMRLPFKERIKTLFYPGIRNRFTVVHTRFSITPQLKNQK